MNVSSELVQFLFALAICDMFDHKIVAGSDEKKKCKLIETERQILAENLYEAGKKGFEVEIYSDKAKKKVFETISNEMPYTVKYFSSFMPKKQESKDNKK